MTAMSDRQECALRAGRECVTAAGVLLACSVEPIRSQLVEMNTAELIASALKTTLELQILTAPLENYVGTLGPEERTRALLIELERFLAAQPRVE